MIINLISEIKEKYDEIYFFLYKEEKMLIDKHFEKYVDFINKVIEKKDFRFKNGEKISIVLEENNDLVELNIIGLGKKEKSDNFTLRTTIFKGVEGIKNKKIAVISESIESGKLVAESILFSEYKFDKYKEKSKEEKNNLNELEVSLLGNISLEELNEAISIRDGVFLARNLVNEPANVIYPETLAIEAVKASEKYGFTVDVYDEEKIKELGMEAFLAVSRAAHYRPKLIVMKYLGDPTSSELIGLVGKGLTYDTGGLSLKPSTSMDTMKSDMGGAATVIGALSIIASQKIKKNVVAVIAACENSIGGNAYRPGDIIGTMQGKTIEVLNTDAEGRLTLVDAIHYTINNEKATKIVDIATLTGAALVALGTTTTAAISNNDEFYKRVEEAANLSDERLWRLPNFPEYGKLLESKIADLKNIGGKYAGTITAGMFIEKFVGKTPWVHLDIAGTSWTDAPYDFYTYGGTGQIVKTLYNLIKL